MWKLVSEQIRPDISLEAKMTRLNVRLQAHQEKAGFLGEDDNPGKNRRQQEKRKTWNEGAGLHQRKHRPESAGARTTENRTGAPPSLTESPGLGAKGMAGDTHTHIHVYEIILNKKSDKQNYFRSGEEGR